MVAPFFTALGTVLTTLRGLSPQRCQNRPHGGAALIFYPVLQDGTDFLTNLQKPRHFHQICCILVSSDMFYFSYNNER
jgi:hypothetical protein